MHQFCIGGYAFGIAVIRPRAPGHQCELYVYGRLRGRLGSLFYKQGKLSAVLLQVFLDYAAHGLHLIALALRGVRRLDELRFQCRSGARLLHLLYELLQALHTLVPFFFQMFQRFQCVFLPACLLHQAVQIVRHLRDKLSRGLISRDLPPLTGRLYGGIGVPFHQLFQDRDIKAPRGRGQGFLFTFSHAERVEALVNVPAERGEGGELFRAALLQRDQLVIVFVEALINHVLQFGGL